MLRKTDREVGVFAYQVYDRINTSTPAIRLDVLESGAVYVDEDEREWGGGGDTLMHAGLRLAWKGD
jgi:hypothetical protein